MCDQDRAEGESNAARADDAKNSSQDREVIEKSDSSRNEYSRLENRVNAREQVRIGRPVEGFEILVGQPAFENEFRIEQQRALIHSLSHRVISRRRRPHDHK